MTPQSTMKVRLVRCPKCLLLLAELPDMSFYTCGGCGTVLQAKHRKIESNHMVDSVSKMQQHNAPEDEEPRSSNLDFPSPPKEESSPDKDNIGFGDGVGSSGELSEYGSAYNGLYSSPEANRDRGQRSFGQDSEIYDKLYNSDEDSTAGANFSGKCLSSAEACERVKEDDNICFDGPAKVNQPEGKQSFRMQKGRDKIMDEVRLISGRKSQESQLAYDTKHREGVHNYDTVSGNEARSSNQVLTSPPNAESSLDKDSRSVSNDLQSLPDIDHCQFENLPVEGSLNHGKVQSHLELHSERCDTELHESDGESTAVGNLSWEFPSSNELVYEGIKDLAAEATERVEKDDKLYFDEPTKHDQCDGVEFSDHEDQENGWSPVSAEHMEGICNDVLKEETRSLNHDLDCPCKEEFSPEDRRSSNEFLSSRKVKYYENEDTAESLTNHNNIQDSERSDSELKNSDEDGNFLDLPEKVYSFEGGESPGMCRESDNFVEVQNISEHEAQESGFLTVGAKRVESFANNHTHLENDDVWKEVATERGEEINNSHDHVEDNNVSEKVARSINQDLTSPHMEEALLDKAKIRLQDGRGKSMKEFSPGSGVSNDLSSLSQVNCYQSEDPFKEESLNNDHGISSLAPHFRRHDSELCDLDGESTGGGNVGEICSSTELVSRERLKEWDNSYLNQPTRVKQCEGEQSLQACPVGDNILHEVQNLSGHDEARLAGIGSSATEIVSKENGNASLLEDSFKGSPRSMTAGTDNPCVDDKIVTSQMALMGVSVSGTSLNDKHADRSLRRVSQNFGSASSVELFGGSLFADTSPEQRVKRKETTSSVTSRGYYAYDGSESSTDETDGQIPVHVPHSSRRKGKEVDDRSTALKNNRFMMKNMLSSEPEMKQWVSGSLSQHHVIEGSRGNPDEFTENKSHILSGGNTARLSDGGSSRLSLTSGNIQDNHRFRNRSVYRYNMPPRHPGFHSPDKTSYSESDKMDLLRTVCELKDQLNRIQFPKISRYGRFPAGVMVEKFPPFYYDHLTPERDVYVDMNRHLYYKPCDQEKGLADQSNVSAHAFSGEAARYRHQVNCYCLHCRTLEWHSSAPLLPHSLHFENDRSVFRASHKSHNIFGPSSPQHYTSSEWSERGHEAMFGNQRLRDTENLYSRDKYHAAKKHLRPIAHGSPFITCSHCSEILQLPPDFLVFQKRYHQLRCNACSKVLKFSLVGGKHIVPYLPNTLEAGGFSNATNDRNHLSSLQPNFCQHGEPVTGSDDHKRSFCRSCLTEGEASDIVPLSGLVARNRSNWKISSVSSYEAKEDRKMKSINKNSTFRAKNKNLVETFKSVGTSSGQPKIVKPSSEIEELSSPLHQLMGYSSISKVLNRGQENE